ncbi:MAG: hypothetical protein A2V90_09220 [Gammaproteobacteria bacterium RBG_16_57_12]|nr:MAG: hypothetical protein A2V90_09220 [Gammaproteobacteria bacterium RBG_16_57_12]
MKSVRRIFFKGLAAVLPIGLTLYIIYWVGSSAESLLGRFIMLFIPENLYWPGMGLIAGLVLLMMIGLLVNAWVVKGVLEWGEKLMGRIPLVKTLYNAMRDFMGFISKGHEGRELKQVVTTTIGDAILIGFVTRENLSDLPFARPGLVAVYFPMSYQIGGYTLYLPREKLTPLNIPVEQAMGLVLTAGVTSNRSADTSSGGQASAAKP